MHLQYLVTLVSGVIELVFFTGLIFGWSSINNVLKKEGYFNYLCEAAQSNITNATGTLVENSSSTVASERESTPAEIECNLKDESLSLVFTIASFMLSVCTLPNGYIFDRYGTWISRTIAILLVTLGALLVSFSSVETSLLLFPAMCGFSVGGILLLVTNMQLGNLYPRFKSSIITLMNGSLDSSSVVFLLVKLAYDNGYSFQSIFLFMAFCTIFLWLRTFVLMPCKHIPFPLPKKGFHYGISDCCDCINSKKQVANATQEQEVHLAEKEDLKEMDLDTGSSERFLRDKITFWACIKTAKFWMNVFHFGVLQLRNYFFFSSFGSWLQDLLSEQDKMNSFDEYVKAFGVCQFFGIVCAPLNGLLIDGVKYHHRSYRDKSSINLLAIAASACTTSCWGLLFSLCVLLPISQLQYVSFVLQVAFRSFLYGGNASFIALVFPIEHFGKIYGMTMTLAGIISLLQFPLYSLVLRSFEGNFMVINIIFLVVCALTFVHPFSLYLMSKKVTDIKEKVDEIKKEKSSLTPSNSEKANEND